MINEDTVRRSKKLFEAMIQMADNLLPDDNLNDVLLSAVAAKCVNIEQLTLVPAYRQDNGLTRTVAALVRVASSSKITRLTLTTYAEQPGTLLDFSSLLHALPNLVDLRISLCDFYFASGALAQYVNEFKKLKSLARFNPDHAFLESLNPSPSSRRSRSAFP